MKICSFGIGKSLIRMNRMLKKIIPITENENEDGIWEIEYVEIRKRIM